jgi:hypothetical protein
LDARKQQQRKHKDPTTMLGYEISKDAVEIDQEMMQADSCAPNVALSDEGQAAAIKPCRNQEVEDEGRVDLFVEFWQSKRGDRVPFGV